MTPNSSPRLWIVLLLLAGEAVLLCRFIPDARSRPSAARRVELQPLPAKEVLPGSLVEGELRPREFQAYRIHLRAGELLQGSVEPLGIDVVVALIGPSGKRLLDLDPPGGVPSPQPFAFLSKEDGDYRLEVGAAATATSPGSYHLALDPLDPTGADRGRADAYSLLSEGNRLFRSKSRVMRLRAELPYTQASSFFAKAGEARQCVIARFGLGRVLGEKGQGEDSRRSYHEALSMLHGIGDQAMEAVVREYLGRSLNDAGLSREAVAQLEQARHLYAKVGDPAGEADALGSLALSYRKRGRLQAALDLYQESLKRWRSLGRRTAQGTLLNNIGVIDLELGRFEEALESFDQALALHRAEGDLAREAIVLSNSGVAYRFLGRIPEGIRSLRRAIDLAHGLGELRTESMAFSRLGNLYIDAGRIEEASGFFQEELRLAREVADPRIEDVAFADLAYVRLLTGKHAEAFELFTRARIRFEERNEMPPVASTLFGTAQALRALGRMSEARAAIARSLDVTESLRAETISRTSRSTFLDLSRRRYDFAVDLLMDLRRQEPAAGLDALAFDVTERARARSVLEELAETGTGIDSRALGHPLHLAEIQQEVLDNDTLLLSYFLAEPKSFVWVVGRGSITSRELPGRAELEASARRFHTAMAESGKRGLRARAVAAAWALSRQLLAPVARELRGRRLWIAADGPLQYVPFGALPDPDPLEDESTAFPRPLIERFEVASVPSASALAVLRRLRRERPPAPLTVAVLADAVFQTDDPRMRPAGTRRRGAKDAAWSDLPRLPHTRKEALAILALTPPGQGRAFLGFNASLRTVLSGALSRFRILHFATHGQVSDAPERSGIVLSLIDEQGRPQDGFLQSSEVYRLHLPAELVVLSACKTALGEDVAGEGLGLLTRGFLHAGAKGVIVSLWEVDDEATFRLMEQLYQGLLREGLPPAAALRAAQLSIQRTKRWQEPYYWAGFILQGEG